MANNKVTATFEVTDKGTFNKVTEDAKKLRKEVDATTNSVKTLNNAKQQSTSSTLQRNKAIISREESTDYAKVRGGVGTGAAGRDFSKQAQGLGGLVHVYAAFAANIFAVTAAYAALDKAFTVKRLEQSADIMSGRLGFSIKNMSKDLVDATDHAISFHEAMQFTNMGIAAGLTAKQITNLTVIAKGAANALGRDMGDAVRRIVQGTAKQEQEILDELGIFVRAKTAYAEYAKKIGAESGDALTAQQRVQAYAEEVTKAGEKWKEFATIEDPFARFSASIKDTGLNLINIVNKALVPILDILSKSKILIEGLLLSIVAKIGAMALPKLGEQLKGVFGTDAKSIEKYTEGFNTIIATRTTSLNKLKESQKELGNSIKDSYRDMNKGGIDFGNIFAEGVLAKKGAPTSVDTTNKAAISDRLSKTIQAGIKKEIDLEAAKGAKLITQNSTLTNIKINKQTLNRLTERALVISKEQNIALATYSKTQDKIISNEALLVGIEEGRTSQIKERVAYNRNLAATAAKTVQGHLGSEDIGWFSKGTDKEDWGKFRLIFNDLGNSITRAEGKLGKIANTFKAFGQIAGIALGSIMRYIPHLLILFTAWEIIFKPLAYAVGIFSEQEDRISEASERLTENSKAAHTAMKRLNEELNKSISGEDLSQVYVRRAQSLSAAKESIDKLIEELKGKEDKGGSTGLGESPYLAGTIGRRYKKVEKSAELLSVERLVATATPEERKAEGYLKLIENIKELTALENQAGYNEITRNKYTSERIVLLEKQSLAVLELQKADELRNMALTNTLEPSKAASKSIQEYIDKSKEATNEEISSLGIKETALQKAYIERTKAFNKLIELKDKKSQEGAIVSISKDMIEDLSAVGPVTDEVKTKIQELLGELTGTESQQAFAKLSLILSGGLLALQGKFKSTSGKDKISQLTIQLSQEQFKYAKILSSEEEKISGFISQGTLNKLKSYELSVLNAEKAKELKNTTDKERQLVEDRYTLKRKELDITYKQKEQQAVINRLKIEEIEPAKSALEIAKAEYNYKKATIGTSALDDIKQEAEQRRKEFSLRQEEILVLEGIKQEQLQRTLDKEIQIAQINTEISIIALQKKERQESLNLALDLYIARQEELIKGEDKLAIYDKLKLNFAEIKKAQIEEELNSINKIVSIELRLLKTAQLKVSVEKSISDEKKRQHEIDKKRLEEALGTKDYKDVLREVGGWSTIMFNEAHKRTSDFKDSMRNVITGAFDGLYAGIDTAIDNLTTKWMKSQKLSLKEIVLDFRNAVAEEFRKMAAEQMKLSARKTIETIILAATGKDIKERNIPKAQLEYLKSIDKNIATLVERTKIEKEVRKEQTELDRSFNTGLGLPPKEEEKSAIDKVKDKSEKTLEGIGAKSDSVFTEIFDGVALHIDNIFGAQGLLATGFDFLKSVLRDLFSTESASTSSGTTALASSAGGFISTGVNALTEALGWGTFMANGGIMSQYGALKLNTYASGGVASSPQVAIFGEGRQNEAYVPLPDGRNIPVKMDIPPNTGQNTGPISISVTVNTTTGQSNTQVNGAQGDTTNAMAEFGKIISQKVKEEIINQSRPNGLLNR